MTENNVSASVKNKSKLDYFSWIIIVIMIFAACSFFFITNKTAVESIHLLFAMGIAVFAFIHGYKRYGWKNMIIFFIVTWIVSNFFESLSIATGIPFGHYHYTMAGPRIVNVPLAIMPTYFGMGYMSFNIAEILTDQYDKKLKGIQTFFIPFIGSFVMVMWDLIMDPSASTIYHRWIWHDGGNYFGVPLLNYLGWFLVVYIFMQIFAIWLAKFDTREIEPNTNKAFWIEPVIVYGLQALTLIAPAITEHTHVQLYSSTALVCVFTMIFAVVLAIVNLVNKKFD